MKRNSCEDEWGEDASFATADDRDFYRAKRHGRLFGRRPCQKANSEAQTDTVSNSTNKMRIYLQSSAAAPQLASAVSEDHAETVPAAAGSIERVIAKIKVSGIPRAD
jgi:hypothetical protein